MLRGGSFCFPDPQPLRFPSTCSPAARSFTPPPAQFRPGRRGFYSVPVWPTSTVSPQCTTHVPPTNKAYKSSAVAARLIAEGTAKNNKQKTKWRTEPGPLIRARSAAVTAALSSSRGRCCSAFQPGREVAGGGCPPLGAKDGSQGLQAAVCLSATRVQRRVGFGCEWGFGSGSGGRNLLPAEQGSNRCRPGRRNPRGFLLQVFHCSKEGRGTAPHLGSSCSERLSQEIQVQDAHPHGAVSSHTPRRLVHFNRSPGRVFSHSYLSCTQEISQVRLPGHGLRIQGTPIRTFSGSESVYEVCGGSSEPAAGFRSEDSFVYRRLSSLFTLRSSVGARLGHPLDSSHRFGFQNKLYEKLPEANAAYRISGHHDRLRPLQSHSDGQTEGEVSPVPLPLQRGMHGRIQNMSQSTGLDGLTPGCGPARTSENEGFSAVGGHATSVPPTSPSSPRYGDDGLPRCSQPVARSGTPQSRSSARICVAEEGGNVRLQPNRLGSCSRGQISEWDVAITAPLRAHKLLGVDGGVSSSEAFPAFSPGLSCLSEERQHHDGGLHKPPGWDALPAAAQTGSQHDNVEQCAFSVSARDARPGQTERGSGSPVKRESRLRRMGPQPPGSGTGMGEIRPGVRRSLRIAGKRTVSSVLIPGARRCTSGCGCAGSPVAKRAALRISPSQSDISHSGESEGTASVHHLDSPPLARETLASGDSPVAFSAALAAPVTQGPSVPSERRNLPSSPRPHGSLGLARERLNLTAVGLPPGVVETIQGPCVSSRSSR